MLATAHVLSAVRSRPARGRRSSDLALQVPRSLTVREVPIDGAPIRGRLRQQKTGRGATPAASILLFLDWGLTVDATATG